jgi:hypothetical protein
VIIPFRVLISISAVVALSIPAIGPKSAKAQAPLTSVGNSAAQIRALKITVLSTMLVGDALGLGEWGFSGIEAVYRLRERAGLTRKSAIVGSVGSMFTLGEGIRPGGLAK